MARRRIWLVLAYSLAWLVLNVATADARSDRMKGARPFESAAETVDLFQAVEEGVLEVRVIPRDSKECRVLIENVTDRKVNVQMPPALAAVPVLAQLLDGGQDGRQPDSSAPQRLGVGNPFGQQNPLQMGPNMQGNPLMNPGNQPFFAPFSIAPEKVAQLKLPAVCLDHGHPNPRPAMRYRLVPLASVSDSKPLETLCRELGRSPASQVVAQAVAWHLSNGKTWQELAAMKVRRLGYPDTLLFTRNQIAQAKAFVEKLDEEAEGDKAALAAH